VGAQQAPFTQQAACQARQQQRWRPLPPQLLPQPPTACCRRERSTGAAARCSAAAALTQQRRPAVQQRGARVPAGRTGAARGVVAMPRRLRLQRLLVARVLRVTSVALG
jgi:hypothetical protein